jgi:DNA polymerase lambda
MPQIFYKASPFSLLSSVLPPRLCSHKGLLPKLVARLKEMDFLTEDLLVGPSHSAEETDHGVDTYFGLCKYPGRELRHRIDFKVTPTPGLCFDRRCVAPLALSLDLE